MAAEIFAMPQQHRIYSTPTTETIAGVLDENSQLVTVIAEYFNTGRIQETMDLQKQLHRNLVYLTCLAYPNKPFTEILNLIPSPETCRKNLQIQEQEQRQAFMQQYASQQHLLSNSNQTPQIYNPHEQVCQVLPTTPTQNQQYQTQPQMSPTYQTNESPYYHCQPNSFSS